MPKLAAIAMALGWLGAAARMVQAFLQLAAVWGMSAKQLRQRQVSIGREGMRLRVASVLATVLSLAAVRDTRAATIETYDFTQGGYTSSIEPLFSGVLTGHFTGAVEASGFIELADLSSIALVFTITFELGNHQTTAFDGPTTFFSFDVAGGSSSLGLATGDGSVATACVGAAAAFGFPGCGSGGVNGSIFGGLIPFSTQAVPQVTLVSSATGGVPEPSTWAMMLLGFVGLGFAGYRASRRTAAANLRASRSQPRV